MSKFIKSVIAEMKLTTWPTAKENRHDTGTVLVTSILFALFFAGVDWVLLKLLQMFILK
ncbi:preprotein translocase subunit SecE [Agrilactobacillus fermenti]|uniref:preprotein translocase subunit SecE n=1 Tax=Agrilactobacillus fermenti TaxID=2586909 RepID=UPI001E5A1518|nr:preprotein translocase subunit SecE [Agrilactobacillus fermenti]MCD2255427.1 preprotein translocase subunit SecE [Agrilactobacillus fermenti]